VTEPAYSWRTTDESPTQVAIEVFGPRFETMHLVVSRDIVGTPLMDEAIALAVRRREEVREQVRTDGT
jgi:hypothetical protein